MSGKSSRLEKGLRASFLAAGVACAGVLGVGLSDEDGARNALLKQGWEPVQSQGHVIFGCGEGDLYRNKFTARNPQGKEVEVVVCRSPLKGSTIRTL